MYKHMYMYTHIHIQERVLRLLPPSFARVLFNSQLSDSTIWQLAYQVTWVTPFRDFYCYIVQALPKRPLLVILSSSNYYSLELQQNSMRAFIIFFFFFAPRFPSRRERVSSLLLVSRNGHCVISTLLHPCVSSLGCSLICFHDSLRCHRIHTSAWTDLSRGDLPNDSRQSLKKHTFRNLYVFFSPRARY